MLIDCDTCVVRGTACAGCMMSAVLDASTPAGELDPDEDRAVEVFARAGFDVQVVAAGSAGPALRLLPSGRRRRVA